MSDNFQQKLFDFTGIEEIQYADISEEIRDEMREGLSIDVTSTGRRRPIRTIKERCRGGVNVYLIVCPR